MAINLLIQSKDKQAVISIINKDYIIGRSKKSDIIVNDEQISGSHCKLSLRTNSELFVEDLNSTNGTLVNGSRITKCRLFIGDTLQFGKISITIETATLSPKEYRAFFNKDRTQIRFIDPKVGTKTIQRGHYEEELKKRPIVQKPNEVEVIFDICDSDKSKTSNEEHPKKEDNQFPQTPQDSSFVESQHNCESFNFDAQSIKREFSECEKNHKNSPKEDQEEKLGLDFDSQYEGKVQAQFLKLGEVKEKKPSKKFIDDEDDYDDQESINKKKSLISKLFKKK